MGLLDRSSSSTWVFQYFLASIVLSDAELTSYFISFDGKGFFLNIFGFDSADFSVKMWLLGSRNGLVRACLSRPG